MIIRKGLGQNPTPPHDKSSMNQVTFINVIMAIYKPTATIMLSGKKGKDFH